MSLSEFTKQAIFEQWSFLAEATFELTAQGSSRAVYFVRASEHQFVLKFYAATTAIAQIHYEHSLLTFLDSAHLPFAIPVPLQTASGETFIVVEVDGQLLNAALLPRLVGHPMERRNRECQEFCVSQSWAQWDRRSGNSMAKRESACFQLGIGIVHRLAILVRAK
ncbi:phosphotransferase [Trichocoleus sp. FACHB-591]|uniref:phosphotransferase n=1 Tax=Trichocoleus sp. FACHB-591 TaxID=2692872 RepID=UPI0016826900|nr:phosphotransferase [Trichocoleus sp. FACHB-591]